MKSMSMIFGAVLLSLCAAVICQDDKDSTPLLTTLITTKDLTSDVETSDECPMDVHALLGENAVLREEIEQLKSRIKSLDEEPESEESNESHSRSRGLRSRRAATCDAGTLAAWACAPQCIFKLKGLCGLSLKSICHC